MAEKPIEPKDQNAKAPTNGSVETDDDYDPHEHRQIANATT